MAAVTNLPAESNSFLLDTISLIRNSPKYTSDAISYAFKGFWNFAKSVPSRLSSAVVGSPKFVSNVIISAPGFIAEEYGSAAGGLAAVTGYLYFMATTGARLFAKSTIVRPIVLTLIAAAFPQAALATDLITMLTSTEILGELSSFAIQAATMSDKGAMGGKWKWGKEKGKKQAENIFKALFGDFPKDAPAKRYSWAGWKHKAANVFILFGGLVGGFAGATWGAFLTRTTATAAIGIIRGLPVVGPTAAVVSSLSAVVANLGTTIIGSLGTAFVLVSTKESFDAVSDLGSDFGKQRVKDLKDISVYAVETGVWAAQGMANGAKTAGSTLFGYASHRSSTKTEEQVPASQNGSTEDLQRSGWLPSMPSFASLPSIPSVPSLSSFFRNNSGM